MKTSNLRSFVFACLTFLIVLIIPQSTSANHSWNNYHWARTSSPFSLSVGDNLSLSWKPYLASTVSDWSQSSVLDMTVISGLTSARRCRASLGRVEVCNYTYGRNGWLGQAQIWLNGEHITSAVTKLNDTYFRTTTYNTPAWKNLVMCQEVGHTLGLDHQDENLNNLPFGTCMDYTSDPTPNQHPNQHDYSELETIYEHLDSFNSIQTLAQSLNRPQITNDQNFENQKDWGRKIKQNQKLAVYFRDLGSRQKLLTFVIFAKD